MDAKDVQQETNHQGPHIYDHIEQGEGQAPVCLHLRFTTVAGLNMITRGSLRSTQGAFAFCSSLGTNGIALSSSDCGAALAPIYQGPVELHE